MIPMRYIGESESHIGPNKLNIFGQRIQLDSKLAEDAIRAGVPLLSEVDWAKFEFTDTELRVWAHRLMSKFDVPSDSDEAAEKAAFEERREAALQYFREQREIAIQLKQEEV